MFAAEDFAAADFEIFSETTDIGGQATTALSIHRMMGAIYAPSKWDKQSEIDEIKAIGKSTRLDRATKTRAESDAIQAQDYVAIVELRQQKLAADRANKVKMARVRSHRVKKS